MGTGRRTAALALLCAGLAAGAAQADFWSGFYRSNTPKVSTPKRADSASPLQSDTLCVAEILNAQARYGIPDNLLLAIGLQEAGRKTKSGFTVWPWTVNAAGKGAFFPTKQAMLDWVRQKQASGVRSIDVGCMQVNQKWHGKEFASLEHAGDPKTNVQYAARYLKALYREEGDWWKAAGRYHSATQKYQQIYLNKLSSNLRAAQGQLERFADLRVTQTAALDTPKPPVPPVFWGGAETGDTPDYSIYSNQPIQPLLPGYEERF